MTSKRTMRTAMGGRITTCVLDEVVSLATQERDGVGGDWLILAPSEAMTLVRNLSVAIAFALPGARKCAWCHTAFIPARSWAKFCGKKCRTLSWEAAHPRVGRKG